MAYFKAGTKIQFRGHVPDARALGQGLSYGPGVAVLLEDARGGNDGGWDVVDIRLPNGGEESIYSFSITAYQTCAADGSSGWKHHEEECWWAALQATCDTDDDAEYPSVRHQERAAD